jgi:hypothetical protein
VRDCEAAQVDGSIQPTVGLQTSPVPLLQAIDADREDRPVVGSTVTRVERTLEESIELESRPNRNASWSAARRIDDLLCDTG